MAKNKAIFFDRDGVINKEIGDYVTRIEDFEVLPGVLESLLAFQEKGYLLIVVTNQGGIAKGLYTHETLHAIHQKMKDSLPGVKFTEIYYSPDHPECNGLSLSRKPGSMMIEKAIARFEIDPSISYLIGDNIRDIEAGEKVGLRCFQINSNASWAGLLSQIA